MIDIHCHLLYGVDDGPRERAESVEMLGIAADQGIDRIILTPHYRHGMFPYPKDRIIDHYRDLVPVAQSLGIDLQLGCEFHVNSYILEYLENKRCLTLAGTSFVLTEYAFETEYSYIFKNTKELINNGYIPVIAHVERYGCLLKKPDLCRELSELGTYIQCNADAILGLEGGRLKRFTRKLLKNKLVDIVASDSHGVSRRANHMADCYALVKKKYGESYAEDLFCRNPGQIVK